MVPKIFLIADTVRFSRQGNGAGLYSFTTLFKLYYCSQYYWRRTLEYVYVGIQIWRENHDLSMTNLKI